MAMDYTLYVAGTVVTLDHVKKVLSDMDMKMPADMYRNDYGVQLDDYWETLGWTLVVGNDSVDNVVDMYGIHHQFDGEIPIDSWVTLWHNLSIDDDISTFTMLDMMFGIMEQVNGVGLIIGPRSEELGLIQGNIIYITTEYWSVHKRNYVDTLMKKHPSFTFHFGDWQGNPVKINWPQNS